MQDTVAKKEVKDRPKIVRKIDVGMWIMN